MDYIVIKGKLDQYILIMLKYSFYPFWSEFKEPTQKQSMLQLKHNQMKHSEKITLSLQYILGMMDWTAKHEIKSSI